jgi:hypothetical protein
MLFNDDFWLVFLQLLEPNLHTSIVFFKTHALHLHSLLSFAPAAGSTDHVGWVVLVTARVLHTLEEDVRDGHAPPFLAVHGGDGVYGGRSTVGWCW